jgi:hypothetical protein
VIVVAVVLYFVVGAKTKGDALTIITAKTAICIIGKTNNFALLFIFGTVNKII